MAELLLGPVLCPVGDREATVWVETDSACEVEVLGQRSETFGVEEHHYALLVLEELAPGQTYEYEVELDGEIRWPEPGSVLPPSVIQTIDPERPPEIALGSCHVALPQGGRAGPGYPMALRRRALLRQSGRAAAPRWT
jgi:hypothetical protein